MKIYLGKKEGYSGKEVSEVAETPQGREFLDKAIPFLSKNLDTNPKFKEQNIKLIQHIKEVLEVYSNWSGEENTPVEVIPPMVELNRALETTSEPNKGYNKSGSLNEKIDRIITLANEIRSLI